MSTQFTYCSAPPLAEEFASLRNSAGWGLISNKQAEAVLQASLCVVTLRTCEGECVGVARAIGDGLLNLYIQDVILAPNYRGKGLGRTLIGKLLQHIKTFAPEDCTIGLMAAHEQDGFYKELGFTARPSKSLGAGFTASLKSITKSHAPIKPARAFKTH